MSHKGGEIITRKRRRNVEERSVFCSVIGENGKHTTSGEWRNEFNGFPNHLPPFWVKFACSTFPMPSSWVHWEGLWLFSSHREVQIGECGGSSHLIRLSTAQLWLMSSEWACVPDVFRKRATDQCILSIYCFVLESQREIGKSVFQDTTDTELFFFFFFFLNNRMGLAKTNN